MVSCREGWAWAWGLLVRSQLLSRVTIAAGCGALGGAFNALAILFMYGIQLMRLLRTDLSPFPYEPVWLYNKLVWGMLWGMALLIIPGRRPHYLLRGLFFGLFVSYVHMLVVFPLQGDGIMGKKLGWLTFIPINISDVVWGLVSFTWYNFIINNQLQLNERGRLRASSSEDLRVNTYLNSKADDVTYIPSNNVWGEPRIYTT
ncbi:hypothetical protein QOT17_002494 [Balamuthia mandrillaris]